MLREALTFVASAAVALSATAHTEGVKSIPGIIVENSRPLSGLPKVQMDAAFPPRNPLPLKGEIKFSKNPDDDPLDPNHRHARHPLTGRQREMPLHGPLKHSG